MPEHVMIHEDFRQIPITNVRMVVLHKMKESRIRETTQVIYWLMHWQIQLNIEAFFDLMFDTFQWDRNIINVRSTFKHCTTSQ